MRLLESELEKGASSDRCQVVANVRKDLKKERLLTHSAAGGGDE
jgi:hypothetical protein